MTFRRGWVVLMLMSMLVIAYVDRVALSIAAKPVSSAFGLSPVAMGYLFSAFIWSYVVCIVPVSMLMDRHGTKIVAGSGLLVWSIATVMTATSTNFTTLVCARLLLGVGESACFPAAGRVIREWIPERERGQVSTLFNSGSSAGTAIGAPLVAVLIGWSDWRWSFVVLGCAGAVCALVWLVWYRKPEVALWLPAREREVILAQRDPVRAGHAAHAPGDDTPPTAVLDLLKNRSVWGLMLTQGSMVYTGYLFFTWLPSYLQATLGLSLSRTGLFTSIPFASAIVVGLICARVCDRRMTPARVAAGGRRYFIAGAMLLGLTIVLARFAHTPAALLVVLSCVTLANNLTTALNLALVNDLVNNPRDAGRVVGLTVLGGNLCGMLAPVVTGYVVARTGAFDTAFAIAAGLLLFGASACLVLSRHRIGTGPADPFHLLSSEPART